MIIAKLARRVRGCLGVTVCVCVCVLFFFFGASRAWSYLAPCSRVFSVLFGDVVTSLGQWVWASLCASRGSTACVFVLRCFLSSSWYSGLAAAYGCGATWALAF